MTVGTFEYTDFSDVDSSAIRSVYYNSENRELAVVFNGGGTSIYDDVPYEVFSGIIDSASPGSAYNRNVKGVYNSRYRTAIYGVKFEHIEELHENAPFAEISDPEELPVQRYLIKGLVPASFEVSETSVEKAVARFKAEIAELGYTSDDLVIKEVTIKFD